MFPAPWGRAAQSAGRRRLRGPEARIAIGFAVLALGAGGADGAAAAASARTQPSPPATSRSQVTKAKFPNHQSLAEIELPRARDQERGQPDDPRPRGDDQHPGQGDPNEVAGDTRPAQARARSTSASTSRTWQPEPAGLDPRGAVPEAAHGRASPLKHLDKAPTAGAERRADRHLPVRRGGAGRDQGHRLARDAGPRRDLHGPLPGRGGADQGKAKAVTPDGSPVKGEFVVTISAKPPQTCVTGSGQVVRCGRGPE